MPLFQITSEYQTLRSELLESRKWVFERPLLIGTLCIAAFNYIQKPFSAYIPMIIIALLLFNLWFTVNRLRSIARIVAYIQVVLENNNIGSWIGWESFLRNYRKFTKTLSKHDLEKLINDKIEHNAVPDAMMYYPPIFNFHCFIVVLAMFLSSYLLFENTSENTITSFALTAGFFVIYYVNAYYYRPKKMKSLIEEMIVVCKEVLLSK